MAPRPRVSVSLAKSKSKKKDSLASAMPNLEARVSVPILQTAWGNLYLRKTLGQKKILSIIGAILAGAGALFAGLFGGILPKEVNDILNMFSPQSGPSPSSPETEPSRKKKSSGSDSDSADSDTAASGGVSEAIRSAAGPFPRNNYVYRMKVVKTYPHEEASFTQGLV
jgi:hypothetical protein